MSVATSDLPRVVVAGNKIVPRPELTGRLRTAVLGKLTTIVAPPGYGKTTLLRQWAADNDGVPITWLSLDSRDNDGRRLAGRLVAALAGVDHDTDALTIARMAESDQQMGDRFIAALLEEMELADPTVLVIDEVDTLTNSSLLLDLRAIIHHSPPTLSVVVATRFEPDRPWLQEPTTQLGQLDLAFGHEHAAVLLETISQRDLSERQIDEILDKTEGWPTALQLTGLALRDGADADAIIEHLTGADQFIGGYLTEEVLSKQSEPVRRFLLRTSVLSQLSGPLCDALTGEANGSEMLATLSEKSIFLGSVGGSGEWFRYHRLFQEFAQHQLRLESDGAEKELLHAAAVWHRAQGELEAAVSYLIKAGDWDQVLDVVTTGSRDLLGVGDAATVLSWLHQVPSGARGGRRDLLLAEAMLRTMIGATIAAEDIVEQLLRSGSLSAGEFAIVNAMRAAWVQHHASIASASAGAEAVLAYLGSGTREQVPDPLGLTCPEDLHSIAVVSRARALWYQGELDRARNDLSALVEPDLACEPRTITALGALALLDTWSGRLHDGHSAATRALVGASRADLISHQSTVDALLAMGSLCRERGQLGRSELLLDQALASTTHIPGSVVLAIHAAECAALDLAADEPRRGLGRIGSFLGSGNRQPPPVIADRLRVVEARLRLATGDIGGARRLIATADNPQSPALGAVTVQIAVRSGQAMTAALALDTWSRNRASSSLEHQLWTAVVAEISGERARARGAMADVVTHAEPEGHIRLFHDAGPEALRLLRSLHRAHPTPYLRRVLEHDPRHASISHRDVVTLSRRELVVLQYLPSQLSNAELAARLFVSQNTVKTHLRSIYRSLDVSGRREAVEKAERLGFL